MNKPRLTYQQAFNFLADLVALVDKVPRETITSKSTLSKEAFRQFNTLLRTRLTPEPRVADMFWTRQTTLDQLVRQLDLENDERSDL